MMKRFTLIRFLGLGALVWMFAACETSIPKTNRSEQSEQVNKLMGADRYARNHPAFDYETLPNSTYILPPEMSNISDREKNFKAQSAFFKKAIPYGGIALLQWEHNTNWQKADETYRDFVSKNKNNPYINAFREHGSYEILVRLHLLGDSSEQAIHTIHFYLQQLITANSFNTKLVYYCLQKLKGHYPGSELRDKAEKAVKNFEQNKRLELAKSQLKQLQGDYKRKSFENPSSKKELQQLISLEKSDFQEYSRGNEQLKAFVQSI